MEPLVKLLCLISILHYCTCTGDSQYDLEIAPSTITAVPFGSGHISIWEHTTVKGRFYAVPEVCLMSDKIQWIQSMLTGMHELRLPVRMWSVEAKELIQRDLVNRVNVTVREVNVLPIERIRFIWVDAIRPLAPQYRLVEAWQSNAHRLAVVTFKIVCRDADSCRELREDIEQSPEQLDGMELQYEISARRIPRRLINVTGADIVRGELFTRLANMPAGSSVRYLSSDDVKKMAAETSRNVFSSVVTDNEYVETSDQTSVSYFLEHFFERQKVSTDSFTPHMWDSVFWDRDNARPDRITDYLNKVVSVDATNSSSFALNQSRRSQSSESAFGLSVVFGGFGGGVSGSSGSSSASATSVAKQDLLNTLRQRLGDVQWSGEKFTVKPMQLSRINLADFSSSMTIDSRSVQVHRYDSVQRVMRRAQCGVEDQRSRLSPDLVQARLTHRIDALTRNITQRIGGHDKLLEKLIAPEFCHRKGCYCPYAYGVPHDERMGLTLSGCMEWCKQKADCNAFDFCLEPNGHNCRLFHSTCLSHLMGSGGCLYYQKLDFTAKSSSISTPRHSDLC